MSETAQNQDAVKVEKPIAILRQRRGGVPRELVERNRRQAADRRRIVDALKSGPKTVPQIAAQANLPPHETLWHLMSMKKYGKLVEGQQQGDYFEYALVQEAPHKETRS
ncbi:MAG: winged helix-turn-helix transcriptional regulator [Candidatus Anammoximicrobium sp.]|nr:winged helix-turn-helix transcriptional regulator [Candidatus Anammoximicrobium sp.]